MHWGPKVSQPPFWAVRNIRLPDPAHRDAQPAGELYPLSPLSERAIERHRSTFFWCCS